MRLLAALAALLIAATGAAFEVGTIREADLPREARETLALIRQGGPLPYAQDGRVFNNRERILPLRSRGYYAEFTVRTPGARGRGARRIVAGRDGEYYYSADHYRSFKRIFRE